MCSFSRPQPRSSMPSKRSRSKIRKPKFISLRRQLSLPSPPPPPPPPPASMSPPPTIDHDRDPPVTSLLDPGDGPSLTSLLGASSSIAASETTSTPSSSSMNWDGEIAIARRALRGRERWVFCCSASSPASEQEASSGSHVDLWCAVPQGLSLKLDYDEILSAWSDKGSLYIDDDSAHQVVPEVYHTLSSPSTTTVFVEVGGGEGKVTGGGGGGAWRVPEVGDEKAQSMVMKAKKEQEEEEESSKRKEAKLGSREERVRRYKEKRQNRLFSKRIRYEVRKLNAEKRPRMKGRFVKRKDDDV
ncbi:CCT domain-containing protein [Dioscorea alata]|uniref:CCT domain-containing protein n=1 Tax=Dioscorea alata TaxID=55571 RepID=A0ACB7WB20_DIOAL|nr:CCT domain-containing protein [Dioscorea alata]